VTKFSAESGFDSSRRRGAMRAGASILAVSALLAAAAPAAAQDDTAADETRASDEAIVVTGIRASLANAQEIKRNADTVVDAITAQDIGALPDRSVTEALQRVPGISINRFAGTNDPDHFSVEGSGVVIRGLNFVRSEFNGRDAFSAGVGGQAINFADVPSELLGSVEVYKNATADLIEGGLAGTVNLNTRKPFDNRGFHVAFSAEANYGDFRKKWTPTASFLISNTWDSGIGTIGLLGSVSYSRIKSRADGIQVTNFQTRDNQQVRFQNGNGVLVCRNPLPGDSDTTTAPPVGADGFGAPCGTAQLPGADGLADPLGVAYAPVGGQYRSQDFDRKRNGIALAAQWESLDGDTKLTAQFLRSHSTNAWGEHTFETAPDLSEYNTYPVGCRQNTNGPAYNSNNTTRAECPVGSFTNYQYDENGLFESGYITLPGTGWRSQGSGSADSFVPTGGMQQSLSRRQVYERNTIADYGLNLEHKFSDRVDMQLDANWTDSSHKVDDMSTFGSTFADQELDITGKLPVLISHKPNTLNADWATPNPDLVNATDEQYFADQRVQFWRAAMDHFEESDGQEFAFRGDLTYHFDDDSFIRKIKTGARYADRDQTIRYTTYNWGVLSEVWSGSKPVSLDQAGGDQAEFYDFSNFFRGQTPGPIGGYYYTGDLIDGYNDAAGFLTGINDIWHTPTEDGGNGAGGANDWERAQDRPLTVEGTPYLPSEIQRVKQRDFNAYVMLNFETPSDSGLRAAGNIGVRFVETRLATQGATLIPSQSDFGITDDYDVRCAVQDPPDGAPPGTQPSRPGGVCNGGAENYALLQQFAGTTGTVVPNSAKNNYRYLLPSLNLRFGVTDDLLFRLAISRVLTRPDTAYVRPYLTTGVDGNGQLTASVGNPYLKPATAWQFDATAEYYFSRVGSITANIFFKDVKNFFYQSTVDLPITNNGITFPFATRGPANYDGHGKIRGFELAYQQTFDFLPGLLNGFGVSGNYSYIKSSGLPNSFLNTGSPVNTSETTPTGNLPLEGLSKHNVNATAFYEKGPVSIRVAYNWRSRFLLTAADVIFPYTSIFNDDTGQLDASIFFNITDNLKIGVQGVNLTNEVTKTLQAYTNDPKALVPRSYFMNDRRFSFILRGNF